MGKASTNGAVRSHRKALRLDQSKLNITTRSRTSRLPWRGQFSPDLVDYFIDAVCPDSRTFLDPFCGSGTVLYEAAIRGHAAWGCEVNPAAWHLAALAELSALPRSQKTRLRSALAEFAAKVSIGANELFRSEHDPTAVVKGVRDQSYDPALTRCLAAAILLGMGDKPDLSTAALARGAFAVLDILTELMPARATAHCCLADARELLLPDESVEAVITSPPYINVFNYHQNYRPAVELLGWRPLEAALSEIGSNRKHRENRFLTVVQYAMDMYEVLKEIARVMVTGAPLIMVIGRTSNVLGASFKNGSMMQKLMMASGSFSEIQCAERSFLNRFGEQIFEDVLITHKVGRARECPMEVRRVGIQALRDAGARVPEKNRIALLSAIEKASAVKPSPPLQLSVPAAFKCLLSFEVKSDESHSHGRTRRQA